MNTYAMHITLLRDGVPRRHELRAESIEQARDIARDYATCLYPMQGLTISVWSME